MPILTCRAWRSSSSNLQSSLGPLIKRIEHGHYVLKTNTGQDIVNLLENGATSRGKNSNLLL